jgi:hypothetical protein
MLDEETLLHSPRFAFGKHFLLREGELDYLVVTAK